MRSQSLTHTLSPSCLLKVVLMLIRYGTFVDYALIDNLPRVVEFAQKTDGLVVVTIPFFWKTAGRTGRGWRREKE